MDGEVTASSFSLVSTQEASESLILTHPALREIDCAIARVLQNVDTNTKADTVEALVDAIDADIEDLQAARHIIFKHAYNRYEKQSELVENTSSIIPKSKWTMKNRRGQNAPLALAKDIYALHVFACGAVNVFPSDILSGRNTKTVLEINKVEINDKLSKSSLNASISTNQSTSLSESTSCLRELPQLAESESTVQCTHVESSTQTETDLSELPQLAESESTVQCTLVESSTQTETDLSELEGNDTIIKQLEKKILSLEWEVKKKVSKIDAYRDSTKTLTSKLSKQNRAIRKLHKANVMFNSEKVRLHKEITRLNNQLFEKDNIVERKEEEDSVIFTDGREWHKIEEKKKSRKNRRDRRKNNQKMDSKREETANNEDVVNDNFGAEKTEPIPVIIRPRAVPQSENKRQETEKREVRHYMKTTVVSDSLGANLGPKLKRKNTCVYVKRGASIMRVEKDLKDNNGYSDSNRLVFLCGTNTIKSLSLGQAVLHYDNLIDSALSLNNTAEVYMTGIPRRWDDSHLNASIISFNNFLQFKASKTERVFYVENDSFLQHKDYKIDGLHLNEKGTIKLARCINNCLNFHENNHINDR